MTKTVEAERNKNFECYFTTGANIYDLTFNP